MNLIFGLLRLRSYFNSSSLRLWPQHALGRLQCRNARQNG